MKKKNFEIRVENSVPKYADPAPTLAPFIKFCKENNCHSIIDVGTGKLRNLIPILTKFNRIWAVDTELQHKRNLSKLQKIQTRHASFKGFINTKEFNSMQLKSSAAMIISVLHAVPHKKQRLQILKSTKKNLRKGGFLLVDVPFRESYYKNRMKKSNKYLDGYLQGGINVKTFHKEFKRNELIRLVTNLGFVIVKELHTSHHHAIICQKM